MGNCVVTLNWKTCEKDNVYRDYVKWKAGVEGFSTDTDPNYFHHIGGYSNSGASIDGAWLLMYDIEKLKERMRIFGETMQRDLTTHDAVDVRYHVEYLSS